MRLTQMLGGFAAVCLFALATARAETLNFDDLSDNGSGTQITTAYGGLNWSNFYVVNTTDYYNNTKQHSGYDVAAVSPSNVAFNGFGNAATMSVSSTSAFTFNSAYFTAVWNDGLTINVTGSLAGQTLDTATFTVNTSGPTFKSFDWTGIDSLTFSSSGGTQAYGFNFYDGTQFAMDDLTIDEPLAPLVATPLPSSAFAGLALLGGFGLILLARRRKGTRHDLA